MNKDELMQKVEGLSEEHAEKIAKIFENSVPKSRFNEVNEAKKNAEALVRERDNQIEELKKSNEGNDVLKQQIADLQEANKKAIEEKDKEIRKVQRDAVDSELASVHKAKNTKAVFALLEAIDETVDIDGYKNKRTEQIEALKKSDGYLFEVVKQTSKKTGITPNGKDPNPNHTVTKEEFAKMGYKDRLNLYNTNKELYEELSNE